MSRVALWVGGHVEDRLAAELVGAAHVLSRRVSTMAELTALVKAGEIDIAVVTATPARLALPLIDACDVAGIRLVAIMNEDADRRHALTMDFHETCRADASWASVLEVLRPPRFDGGGIPEMSFFDITIDAPPAPLPLPQDTPRFLEEPAVTERPSVIPNISSPASSGSSTFNSAGGEAPVIAVWGPTGAPGRTSVAINIAAELTVQGMAVLLIDADPYGGAIAPKLGLLDEMPGFAAVCRLTDRDLLTRAEFERVVQQVQVVAAGGGPLWVLTGILRPDRWPELSELRVARVLEICRPFVDVIVMDVGFSIETDEEISSDLVVPRRNGASLAALGAADTIVAVADSDVVGLARFLRASAEVREMFAHTPLIAAANRVRSGVAGLTPRAQVRQTLERFGGHTDIVLVPHDDHAFDACSLRAAPLCTVAPKSAARLALRDLADRLAPDRLAPGRSSPAGASQSPSQGKRASRLPLFARRRG